MILTVYGALSVVVMMTAYFRRDTDDTWRLVFALACFAAAIYAALTGAWIFAALELIWSVLAFVDFFRVALKLRP